MLEKSPTINKSFSDMTLERMGSRYPSRLSFSRSMLRRMKQEKWVVDRVKFDLDKDGYGTAIYEINTPNQIYSVVCFSQFIPDEERSDRVIAEKWDTAYTMHIGKISAEDLNRLKKNTPLQEAGRNSPSELVLSRGNKSVRLFKKIVNCLSLGKQPAIEEINDVGYLLRTTAVYGSGKFGLSDFSRTRSSTHFDQPFRAEMLAVYIVREFSIHLVEHIAYHQNPSEAVKLDASVKRHIGIGNSTGLGMAPFIIKHPKLIHKWMSQFEKALNQILKIKHIDERKFNKLCYLLKKSKSYLDEVLTTDEYQKTKNKKSFYELDKIIDYCYSIKTSDLKNTRWNDLFKFAKANLSFDAQEIVKVQIIELFPEIADPLAEDMSESDNLSIDPGATMNELLDIIENRYKWSIDTDFQDKNNTYLFWYVSEEKLEPRLGERYNEQGADLEQHLGVGKMVSELYHFLKKKSPETKKLTIARFLLLHPEYRGIIRRIQSLTNFRYGEINDNILAKNTLPINMLRFKLSFFGASRYDPKSDRWLRVSFFAGAPFYEELNSQNVEDWGFATMNSYQ